MFKIITKQSKVPLAIENFLKYYPFYKDKGSFYTELRFKNISKLDINNCSVEEFNTALGETLWTENRCDECTGDFDKLIHIGREPDYETRWLHLCVGCLQKGILELSK